MDAQANHKFNCLICGSDLVYFGKSKLMTCVYCGKSFESSSNCQNGHYICDSCHSFSGNTLIREFCSATEIVDPVEAAFILMRDERIKMHGPEHHFLVPAVLLASFYNITGDLVSKTSKIEQAEKRAKNVLGGFCGFYGACGAAIGTGIFISLLTDSTPLSKLGWQKSNQMTSISLNKIAEYSGPRCCKRDTFLAIMTAVEFVVNHFKIRMPVPDKINCAFSDLNRECLQTECQFFT